MPHAAPTHHTSARALSGDNKSDSGKKWKISFPNSHCSLCEYVCELKYCRKWIKMLMMMNQLLHNLNLQKRSKNLKVQIKNFLPLYLIYNYYFLIFYLLCVITDNDDEETIESMLNESLSSEADSNLLNVFEDEDDEDDVEE
ncbi:hypothetical protein M9H77_08011 [Catharanthus roseus]|uniref:Uncharacterized protein n=1 Tax=Catharanthus roseus TaxID=4058 RepID=A0ACC0BWP2_CATRO|nr:hypothetical protein M9H77_08011 [Catharanthus roseus]